MCQSVGGFGQIAASTLGLAHRVMNAADGALGVAQHHIHSARALNLGRGAAAAGDKRGMRMSSIFEAPELPFAIRG